MWWVVLWFLVRSKLGGRSKLVSNRDRPEVISSVFIAVSVCKWGDGRHARRSGIHWKTFASWSKFRKTRTGLQSSAGNDPSGITRTGNRGRLTCLYLPVSSPPPRAWSRQRWIDWDYFWQKHLVIEQWMVLFFHVSLWEGTKNGWECMENGETSTGRYVEQYQ